jgi:Protein of unknown function (DUF1501)
MTEISMTPPLSRRDWLKLSAAGVVAWSQSGWLERLAAAAAADPARRRSCILLWMSGGPSTIDLWDLKVGHPNGGPYKEIETNAPGLRFGEHLPKLAKWADRMAVIRSMSTKEGDHSQATHLMRTGQVPQGAPIDYPSLGAVVAKELERSDAELPGFVSVGPDRGVSPAAYGPGFLGPAFAPLVVGEGRVGSGNPDRALRVPDLLRPGGVSEAETDARLRLLGGLESDFVSRHPGLAPVAHQTAYGRAVRMMRSAAARAFDLEDEPAQVRDAYGRSLFGQGCLLARRLVQAGVPFVEVTLGGADGSSWDTHAQNFPAVKRLCEILDPAWAALMGDLKERGLLDTTLVVWMGEFGRTPKINQGAGRDHFPNAWSTVLAGGGIKGGMAYGRTSASGMAVEESPVNTPTFLATVCKALGMDPHKQHLSNLGRPIRFVEKTVQPIAEVLA